MVQILTGIQDTANALDVERARLDVISENIANAHTTRGVDGNVYQRQVVVFETAMQQAVGGTISPSPHARIEKDQRPPLMAYQPGHPDADERGMVAMPDINIHEEMADMIAASRAFEANLAVVKNSRAMAMQTLAIGKR